MKVFILVLLASAILGGLVGGELTDRTFLITGAVIGGVGVGAVLLGLGALLTWLDERKARAAKARLPPEIRAVMGRMFGTAQPEKAATPPQSEAQHSPESKEDMFKLSVGRLLAMQLLPSYSEPKQAFSSLMVNRRAAGYVYGMHDAMLQACGLASDPKKAGELLKESYQEIFGSSAGYALLSMSQHDQQESAFHEGRMEGGNELVDFVKAKVPPLGLGRMLILGSSQRPATDAQPKPDAKRNETDEYNKLISALELVFRRTIAVPPTSDAVSKLLQRSSIYHPILPFAYALTVLRRTSDVPGYLESREHASLLRLVEGRMVTGRIEVADVLAKGMPQLPDGPVFASAADQIKATVKKELIDTLTSITDGKVTRSVLVAKANLLQLFISGAPYAKEPGVKEKLYEAMSAFADEYLKASSSSQ